MPQEVLAGEAEAVEEVGVVAEIGAGVKVMVGHTPHVEKEGYPQTQPTQAANSNVHCQETSKAAPLSKGIDIKPGLLCPL